MPRVTTNKQKSMPRVQSNKKKDKKSPKEDAMKMLKRGMQGKKC